MLEPGNEPLVFLKHEGHSSVQLTLPPASDFFKCSLFNLKNEKIALAGVAQWTECWSANQRVASSIPSQGTCLGGRPGAQLGVCERQPTDVSLSFSFPSPLSKNK